MVAGRQDALALAKVDAVRELTRLTAAVMRGDVVGPNGPSRDGYQASDGYGMGGGDIPSANNVGSTTPGFLDSAHRGASQNTRSLLNWGVTSPVDPNLETVYDLFALRARSADLVRNNPIAKGAIGLPVLNVIGPGLTLHPTVDRETLGLSDADGDDWERLTKSLFDKTAAYTDFDLRGTETFYGLQSLAFRSILERGEIFATLPIKPRKGTMCDLRVHLVEADRVSNPELSYDTLWRMSGVETDINGLPVAYWMETTPTWLNVIRTWERAVAFGPKTGRRNVLHLYTQQRVGDKRGVPLLSPVIDTLKQISRYSEAELMAAVISAMFTVFIKSLTGDEDADITAGAMPPSLVPTPGMTDPGYAQGGTKVSTMALGNGAIIELAKDEDIETANPNRPNPNYQAFVDAHIRQIGMAIGIPYEVLTQHFSSSYSASRAALLEVWRFYDERRRWFAVRFCQPIYEEWLGEMVLAGRIAAPGFFDDEEIRRAYCAAEWIGPSPGQLDPVKETNASTMRVNAGFSTLERESRGLNGTNWERNFQQRAKEEAKRLALGLDFTTNINPITGEDDGRPVSTGDGSKPQDDAKPGQSGDTDTE